MSLASLVPGVRLAAPRDGAGIRQALREAVEISDGPTIIRFPKGTVGHPIEPVAVHEGLDVLLGDVTGDIDVLLVAVGAMAETSVAAGEKLAAEGLRVAVVDPRWVLPVPQALVALAARAGNVAVVEDNSVAAGIGAEVSRACSEGGVSAPVHRFGLPKEFIDHASRGQVLESAGLTPDAIVERIVRATPAAQRSES